MIRLPILPILTALVPLLGACADSSNTGQTDAAVPRWSGAVDLTLESPNGKDSALGSVSGLAVDGTGRVVLADEQRNRVAVFDSAGHLLYSIGQRGSRPGEFDHPCCLAFDHAGVLWLRDAGNMRYNRYELGPTAAQFRGQTPMTGIAGPYAAPLTFDASHHVVDVGTYTSGAQSGLVRFHLDSAGQVARIDSIVAPGSDSLGQLRVSRGTASALLAQPYGARFLVAPLPGGGWARAISSHYNVAWTIESDSNRTVTVRRDLIGPALSARERSRADSALKRDAAKIGLTESQTPFGVPGSKTPVKEIFFDQLGRLWVQLNVGDGELSRADVYNQGGRRVGNAEWPADVDLQSGFVGERVAYGLRTDSLGRASIVRVRFR
ncbi:MAG: hypothetical protein ABI679_11385 [Gemmatimonadota bacterium]